MCNCAMILMGLNDKWMILISGGSGNNIMLLLVSFIRTNTIVLPSSGKNVSYTL